MARRTVKVELQGGPQLVRAFRKLDERTGDLRALHDDIGEVIAAEARTLVPVLSGALEASIRAARGKKSSATVRAGGGKGVPYAGPVHFGWHARNIEPQPFLYDALDNRRDEVLGKYRDTVAEAVRRFDREAPDLR